MSPTPPLLTNTHTHTHTQNTVAYVDDQFTSLGELRAGGAREARATRAKRALRTHYLDALAGSASFNFPNICNYLHLPLKGLDRDSWVK